MTTSPARGGSTKKWRWRTVCTPRNTPYSRTVNAAKKNACAPDSVESGVERVKFGSTSAIADSGTMTATYAIAPCRLYSCWW